MSARDDLIGAGVAAIGMVGLAADVAVWVNWLALVVTVLGCWLLVLAVSEADAQVTDPEVLLD